MLAEVVHLAVIAVAAMAAVDRALDLARRPAPGRRALTAALGALAVALVLGHTWVVPTEGVLATGAVWLAQHLLVFAGVFALHLFFLFSARPPSMRRAVRERVVVTAAVGALLVAAWAVSVVVERPVWSRPDFAAQPWSGAANLVFIGFLAYGLVGNARLTAHWARVADRTWLRRGLRLLSTAGWVLLAWAVYKTAAVAAAMAGAPTEFRLPSMLLLAVGLSLGLAGIALPAWAPRAAVALARPARLRSYRRLEPLWRLLRDATPRIELPEPAPWWRVELRLYRRVIEIADGRAALRGHLDPAVAATVEDPAAAEAARLVAAVARSRTGAPPLATTTPERRGGDDLLTEVAWLERVAAALGQVLGQPGGAGRQGSRAHAPGGQGEPDRQRGSGAREGGDQPVGEGG